MSGIYNMGVLPCQGAPIALRMAKAAINQGMDVDLQTAYALEHSYYSQVCTATEPSQSHYISYSRQISEC